MIDAGDVILFQGDSITDAGRSRENSTPNTHEALGWGYAVRVASALLCRRPADRLTFHNRGISGNRVIDLADRWQSDCIDLKPDVLSILIGVNDTWRGFDTGAEHSVAVDRYEQVYRKLLSDARKAQPKMKLVLCEPFVLVCGAVTDVWLPEIDARRRVVAKLCDEFDGRLVAFQQAFDDAAKLAPANYWAADGVHPSVAGHQLMADTWLNTVCS